MLPQLAASLLLTSLGLLAFLILLSIVIRRFIGLQMSLGRIVLAAAFGIGL